MADIEKAFLEELSSQFGLDSWQRRPEDQRNAFIALWENHNLITPAQAYLLDWLPRAQNLNVSDYLTFHNTITALREKLLAQMDTERPPESEPPETQPSTPFIFELEPIHQCETDEYRLLSEDEIIDGFADLGIDIIETLDSWFQFYWRTHYGEKKFGEDYELPLPDMTFKAMEAFKLAWIRGEIDTIMIDDARLRDGETLKSFQPKTSRATRNKCDQFRPVAPESMKAFLDGTLINYKKGGTLTGKERRRIIRRYHFDDIDSQGVRIIGLKTGFGHMDFERLSFDEASDILEFNYTNIIEFGTWVRFLHYLKYEGHSQYDAFLDNISRTKNGNYYLKPEILLNSFTHYGEFVTATAYRNHLQYHTKANPSADTTALTLHALPFVVIQSDSHPADYIEVHTEDDDDDIPF